MTVYRTSGSTGIPKNFTLTPEQETARAAALPATRGAGFADLTSIFQANAGDSSSATRSRHWIEGKGGKFIGPGKDMEATVELILREKPQGVFGAPGFLLNLAGRIGRRHVFDYVGVGSFAFAPEQSIAIRAGLGDNLWAVYSTSETNTIAVACAAEVEAQRGCVGMLCEGVEIRFVDGEVQAKTPTMIAGYDDPALTEAYFDDGWFKTGDLGHMDVDLLILTGRNLRC